MNGKLGLLFAAGLCAAPATGAIDAPFDVDGEGKPVEGTVVFR